VFGTLNLDLATANEELDFFVLFSSISSVAGSMGQSDYASANRFMDAFAKSCETARPNRKGRRTLSINWPLWADGGMKSPAGVVERMRRTSGLVPLNREAGVQIFEEVLCAEHSQVGVLYGDKARVRQVAGLAGRISEGEDLKVEKSIRQTTTT